MFLVFLFLQTESRSLLRFYFQQEDAIQQHDHSQETSKNNSPTIFWLTLLESKIVIEWSWGFSATKKMDT